MYKSVCCLDLLYRAVKRSQPSAIRLKNGKPKVSSSLFKDENGVSVDKKMQRSEESVIQRFKESFSSRLKGIVTLSEQDVMNANAIVIPKPSGNNPYHAEIHKSDSEIELTEIQALKLADVCRFVFFDKDKEWTNVGCTN